MYAYDRPLSYLNPLESKSAHGIRMGNKIQTSKSTQTNENYHFDDILQIVKILNLLNFK